MNYINRFAACLGLALLSSCGDEVCPPLPQCSSLLTIHVRDANDRAVTAFRGTLETDGVIRDIECPGSSQTNLVCGSGSIELFETPSTVSVELASTDGYLRGSLTTRPVYFETEKEQACRQGCIASYTRVVLR